VTSSLAQADGGARRRNRLFTSQEQGRKFFHRLVPGALLTLTDELYSSKIENKIEKRSAAVWRRLRFLRHRTRFEMQTILAGRIVGF
jgi:hypothetical protein